MDRKFINKIQTSVLVPFKTRLFISKYSLDTFLLLSLKIKDLHDFFRKLHHRRKMGRKFRFIQKYRQFIDIQVKQIIMLVYSGTKACVILWEIQLLDISLVFFRLLTGACLFPALNAQLPFHVILTLMFNRDFAKPVLSTY